MKIGFHEDHWWILVNGQKAYRLSIPRDISPEDARKHAKNVLVYLAERAEIVHLGSEREATTEPQPASRIASQPETGSACGTDEFDEVRCLTDHTRSIGKASDHKMGEPPVGHHPVPATAPAPQQAQGKVSQTVVVPLRPSRQARTKRQVCGLHDV
jgi:hypothetical protein